jgi:hypothetical protein
LAQSAQKTGNIEREHEPSYRKKPDVWHAHHSSVSGADICIPGLSLCNGRQICDADAHHANLMGPPVAGGVEIGAGMGRVVREYTFVWVRTAVFISRGADGGCQPAAGEVLGANHHDDLTNSQEG